ncbi:MAG: hypothetical protein IVW54_14295 [Candidatus Binataceae bacterium]|nr:hypothetical protein [Candidatus Binataceae bacterium]
MGWLFAVALGLQERSRAKLIESLFPIAAGHLLSVGLVVALIAWAQAVTASQWLRPAGAAILILFGIFRLVKPRAHPRWVAMRVRMPELALWSFLMASAHGAGLMLFPILMDLPMPAGMHHRMPGFALHGHPTVLQGIAVVLVHTGSMLIVMGGISIAVYEWIGLAILRSAWINLETIWAAALIAAGMLALAI